MYTQNGIIRDQVHHKTESCRCLRRRQSTNCPDRFPYYRPPPGTCHGVLQAQWDVDIPCYKYECIVPSLSLGKNNCWYYYTHSWLVITWIVTLISTATKIIIQMAYHTASHSWPAVWQAICIEILISIVTIRIITQIVYWFCNYTYQHYYTTLLYKSHVICTSFGNNSIFRQNRLDSSESIREWSLEAVLLQPPGGV